jgi:hypothetical protein
MSTQTATRDFNVMGTQRSWTLNMYDTDFGPVGNDIYANFKQQSLGKEAYCKNIATPRGNRYSDGVRFRAFKIQLLSSWSATAMLLTYRPWNKRVRFQAGLLQFCLLRYHVDKSVVMVQSSDI